MLGYLAILHFALFIAPAWAVLRVGYSSAELDRFAQACDQAHGELRGNHECYCPEIQSTIDPTDADDRFRCLSTAAKSALAVLALMKNQNGSVKNHCPSDDVVGGENENLGCPTYLLNRAVRDRKGGWWINSPDSACQRFAKDSVFQSPADFERFLPLGAPHDLIMSTRCQKLSQTFAPKSAPLSAAEQKQVGAEYYYLMSRLRNATLSAIENVSSLDSLLKENIKIPDCADPYLSDSAKWCDRLVSCTPRGGLDQLAKDALPVEQVIEEAQDQLKKPGVETQNKRKLQDLIDGLQAAYPYLDGKQFHKTYQPGKGNLAQAIQVQLQADRDRLQQELASYRKATACLNKELPSSLCDDFDETIEKTPELEISTEVADSRAKANLQELKSYMETAKCHIGTRQASHVADHALVTGAAGAALTIAPPLVAAVGPAFLPAIWGAQAGARGSAILRMLSLSPKLSQYLSVSNALIGGNIAKGLYGAYKDCQPLHNELVESRLRMPPGAMQLSLSSTREAAGPACPKAGYDGPNVQSDSKACLVAFLLDVGPTLLPVLPEAIQPLLSHPIGKVAIAALGTGSGAIKSASRTRWKSIAVGLKVNRTLYNSARSLERHDPQGAAKLYEQAYAFVDAKRLYARLGQRKDVDRADKKGEFFNALSNSMQSAPQSLSLQKAKDLAGRLLQRAADYLQSDGVQFRIVVDPLMGHQVIEILRGEDSDLNRYALGIPKGQTVIYDPEAILQSGLDAIQASKIASQRIFLTPDQLLENFE